MRNIKKLNRRIVPFLVILTVMLASCDLDELPRDRISGDQVFQDEALVTALVADLYSRFPFTGYNISNMAHHDLSTERGSNFLSCFTHGQMSTNNDCNGWWDYRYIRDINTLLDNIRASQLSDAFKNRIEGEVRAIRAVVYFQMQQRYGGVPLLDIVLDPFEEIPQQYLVRSTEVAIADFVDTELAAATGLLVSANPPRQTGRFNQWTVYAYKARANLWAASIAKFGTLDPNGLTGIPQTRANEFFEKASTAAQAVINSGQYTLLQGDAVQTYQNIFIEDSNPEVIFERIYNGVEISHDFAAFNQPTPFSQGQGSLINPTLELVNFYENLDGTFSTPDLGPDNLYPSGSGPWANKDPRLHATVLFEGDLYAGLLVELYEGIDPTVGGQDPSAIVATNGVSVNGKPSIGSASRLQQNQFFPSTGFLLNKYVPPIPQVARNIESNNWKEIRLAEMYLIAAESEFELDNLAEAATFLNFTRNRVGLTDLNQSTITRDRVRIERTSELIYEGHRWFDIRRWRTAFDLLNDQTVQGLRVIYHSDSGQYYFLPLNGEAVQRLFRPEHYYNPITVQRIETQGELVENPGY